MSGGGGSGRCYATATQVIVNIPDEFAGDLVQPGDDPRRAALEASVANEYRERHWSTEQVRRLLGMEYWLDVEAFLLERRIFDYTTADLEADLAVLEQLLQSSRSRIQVR